MLIGICVWLGGMIGFGYTINHLRTDPDVKTDAIVVLTGGRNRIGEAVRLLNRGSAEQLLISGVSRGTSLETMKKRQDVKITTSREITLDEKSTNTVENAIEAAAWVKKKQHPFDPAGDVQLPYAAQHGGVSRQQPGSDNSGAPGLFRTGGKKLVAELAQLCSDRIGIQQVFIRVD